MPIVIETPYIVNLWLGQLPDYVVPFTRLIIVISAIDAMASPLMTAAHATGHIRLYQSSVGTMTILNLPISYIFLKFGEQPLTVFYISLCISTLCLFMRLWIVQRLMDFPVKQYIIQVFGSCVMICAVALAVPLTAHLLLSENFLNTIAVCLLCIISTVMTVYGLGLTKHERSLVTGIIRKKILHNK